MEQVICWHVVRNAIQPFVLFETGFEFKLLSCLLTGPGWHVEHVGALYIAWRHEHCTVLRFVHRMPEQVQVIYMYPNIQISNRHFYQLIGCLYLVRHTHMSQIYFCVYYPWQLFSTEINHYLINIMYDTYTSENLCTTWSCKQDTWAQHLNWPPSPSQPDRVLVVDGLPSPGCPRLRQGRTAALHWKAGTWSPHHLVLL